MTATFPANLILLCSITFHISRNVSKKVKIKEAPNVGLNDIRQSDLNVSVRRTSECHIAVSGKQWNCDVLLCFHSKYGRFCERKM
jgi:hypothetical protein